MSHSATTYLCRSGSWNFLRITFNNYFFGQYDLPQCFEWAWKSTALIFICVVIPGLFSKSDKSSISALIHFCYFPNKNLGSKCQLFPYLVSLCQILNDRINRNCKTFCWDCSSFRKFGPIKRNSRNSLTIT